MALFFYLMIVSVLLRISMTMFDVPVAALIPELTSDYDERTQLASYRVSASYSVSAVMTMAMYAIWLRDTEEFPGGVLNPSGYHDAALVAGAIIAVLLIFSSLALHREIPRLQLGRGIKSIRWRKMVDVLRDLLKNKSMRIMLISGLLLSTGSGTSNALWIYNYTSIYGLSSSRMSTLMIVELVAAIAAIFTSHWISVRGDKRTVVVKLMRWRPC
jgi:Na+/melibiose symporter-like transporter